jgi:hypothetical protein
LHIDSVVFNANEFVDHGLISPLIQQRSHWVVLAVKDEDLSVDSIAAHFRHKFLVFVKFSIEALSNAFTEIRLAFIPHLRIRPSSHAHSKQPINHSVKLLLLA